MLRKQSPCPAVVNSLYAFLSCAQRGGRIVSRGFIRDGVGMWQRKRWWTIAAILGFLGAFFLIPSPGRSQNGPSDNSVIEEDTTPPAQEGDGDPPIFLEDLPPLPDDWIKCIIEPLPLEDGASGEGVITPDLPWEEGGEPSIIDILPEPSGAGNGLSEEGETACEWPIYVGDAFPPPWPGWEEGDMVYYMALGAPPTMPQHNAEPSSLVLGGVGSLLVGCFWRRRFSKTAPRSAGRASDGSRSEARPSRIA